MSPDICPFSVGELVVYQPTDRGRKLVNHTDLAVLVPGNKYRIIRIDRGVYVVVEGFEKATPAGLYWTEFSKHEVH